MRGLLRPFGLVLVLLVGLVPAAGAQLDEGEVSREFVIPAKVTKSPRLQSQLVRVSDVALQRGAAAGLQTARSSGLDTVQAKVRVIVEGSLDAARSAVLAQGGTVSGSAGSLTEALVPPAAVAALSRASGIEYVRAPFAHRPLAATESQGVAASDADDWHAKDLKGAGVKIAVIDGGFAGLADRQASNDLPTVTQVDHCASPMGSPEAHGTAVAEIVHEMAPEAELYLICVDSEVDLATAEAYVKANGITIVNHSVGWYNTSRGDGTGAAGTPAAIVTDARANGILWVNAAGNAAQEHWSGTFADANGNGLGEFAPGDETNQIFLFAGEEVCGFLKWDAWPATNQDFDLYLGRDSDVTIVAGSVNEQTGAQTPTEEFCYTNTTGTGQTFSFLIDRYSATTAPRFDLFVTVSDALQHQTPAGSVTEPASSPSAMAVGAVCWQNSALEPYSSLGPTIDGRVKPDISGPSAVSSGIYGAFSTCGTSGFTGTSSSSPHVAGAAALLKEMFPLATVNELQSWLEADALELGPVAGKDSSTGAGKLRLPTSPPLASTFAPLPSTQPTYNSIQVTGSVSPLGLTTSYYWEYGPTTGYGSQTAPVTLASPRTGQQTGTTLSGLTPDTEYHYRLVATNLFGTTAGQDQTQTTVPALPPDVVTQAPQAVGAENARLAGSVNAYGNPTTFIFEWGTTAAYGNSTTVENAATAGTNTYVAEISGLAPETEYHYRIVATNVHGTTESADQTFTTVAGAAPVAVTLPVQGTPTFSASLRAGITPGGLPTTYHFEWGLGASLSQQSPAGTTGYGTSQVEVQSILNVQPGTQYSYRIVATNALGTSEGDVLTFTTAAAPPPPSGGGGGDGGSVDLAIEGSAQPATARVGDDVAYVLRVTNLTGSLAQGVNVDVQLPAGSQLTGSSADRGSGCAGTPLVCNLEFLNAQALTGTIRLGTRVTAAGAQTLRATVRYALTDPKPENNSVTVVVGSTTVSQPPAVKPPAVVPTTRTGTAGANTLRGTNRAETLRGLGGNDRLFGNGGVDRLFGDAGNDQLYGGVGHDWLYGGAGVDRLYGGSGNDRLFGGPGRDLFEGGSGNDVVSARDRTRDTIRCGAGRDTVVADRVDRVARDCERVTRK